MYFEKNNQFKTKLRIFAIKNLFLTVHIFLGSIRKIEITCQFRKIKRFEIKLRICVIKILFSVIFLEMDKSNKASISKN